MVIFSFEEQPQLGDLYSLTTPAATTAIVHYCSRERLQLFFVCSRHSWTGFHSPHMLLFRGLCEGLAEHEISRG